MSIRGWWRRPGPSDKRLGLSAFVFVLGVSTWALPARCGSDPAQAWQSDFDNAVKLYVKGDLQGALKVLEACEASGLKEKKLSELKKVIQYDLGITAPLPENKTARLAAYEVAEALCEVGFAYVEDEDLARAEELFLQAESKSESFLPARVALAELYQRKGDFQRSLEKWRESVSMAPQNGAVQIGFAVACANAGQRDQAEEILKSLAGDSDLGVRAQVELGRISWNRGLQSEAKAIWEEALSEAPMDGSILFVIADCCKQSGDLQGARIGYRKAIDLGYMPELCKKRLSSLRK